MRDRVIADKVDVGSLYAATARAHPRLASRTGPLAAEHRAHLEALAGSATSPPGPTPPEGPGASSVPATPRDALALLAARERELAARRLGDVAGVSPDLARLLASIGAAEAAHSALLAADPAPSGGGG